MLKGTRNDWLSLYRAGDAPDWLRDAIVTDVTSEPGPGDEIVTVDAWIDLPLGEEGEYAHVAGERSAPWVIDLAHRHGLTSIMAATDQEPPR